MDRKFGQIRVVAQQDHLLDRCVFAAHIDELRRDRQAAREFGP